MSFSSFSLYIVFIINNLSTRYNDTNFFKCEKRLGFLGFGSYFCMIRLGDRLAQIVLSYDITLPVIMGGMLHHAPLRAEEIGDRKGKNTLRRCGENQISGNSATPLTSPAQRPAPAPGPCSDIPGTRFQGLSQPRCRRRPARKPFCP